MAETLALPIREKQQVSDEISFAFTQLPYELQHLTLLQSQITAPCPNQARSEFELGLIEGQLALRRVSGDACCDALLQVNNSLRSKSLNIILANSTVIVGDFGLGQQHKHPDPTVFLHILKQLAHRNAIPIITSLRIRLLVPWLLDLDSTELETFHESWNSLLFFVGQHLKLSSLDFTIDASWECDSLMECGLSPRRLEQYETFYTELSKPLRHLQGVKTLRVMLACCEDLEGLFLDAVLPLVPISQANEFAAEKMHPIVTYQEVVEVGGC